MGGCRSYLHFQLKIPLLCFAIVSCSKLLPLKRTYQPRQYQPCNQNNPFHQHVQDKCPIRTRLKMFFAKGERNHLTQPWKSKLSILIIMLVLLISISVKDSINADGSLAGDCHLRIHTHTHTHTHTLSLSLSLSLSLPIACTSSQRVWRHQNKDDSIESSTWRQGEAICQVVFTVWMTTPYLKYVWFVEKYNRAPTACHRENEN